MGQYFREPRPEISYMDNREEKSQLMIEETINKNITSLNGQPSR